jgi:hypothetical protein
MRGATAQSVFGIAGTIPPSQGFRASLRFAPGATSPEQKYQYANNDDRQDNMGALYLALPVVCFLRIVRHLKKPSPLY